MRKCIQCEKPLPDNYSGDKCSLCAIGLLPSAPVELSPVVHQPSLRYSGRQLSGFECPSCHAELPLRDLGHASCSNCGSRLNVEQLERRRQHPRTPQINTSIIETTLGDKYWPDDAPRR